VVYRVNTMKDNGILGNYHIRERTRVSIRQIKIFRLTYQVIL